MLDQFLHFFNRPELPGKNLRFAAAVSGGIDSMVLSELCLLGRLNFFIVHCNFQLRGAESDRDESFVRSWAAGHGVEVLVERFTTETYAREHKLSIQEAARELRYHWFRQLKEARACDYILLAHQADDSVETSLMNYFRGTGLHGLTGIPSSGPYFLRPLINASRTEIVRFAEAHSINWVEDSSNSSNKYTRNFFRNELLPSIKQVFPAVEENLYHNLGRFRKTELLYIQLVNDLKKKITRPVTGGVKIPVLTLDKWKHTSLLYEIVKDYGFTEKQLPDINSLLAGKSGKYVSSASFRIIKHRNHLVIASLPPSVTSYVTIAEDTGNIEVPGQFILTIQRQKPRNKEFVPKSSPDWAQLDASKLQFPLLLRKWRHGDYFYPLGMAKKKKLSRFFIDQKLSLDEKERIWVLESGERILWVVGLRIDDRFKITPGTKEAISFNVTSL